MMGEQLNAAEVTDRGLLGDRAYALVDRETGKVASAKFPRKWPTLLAHRATYVEPPAGADGLPAVRITLPDGRIVRSDDPDGDRILSADLGRDVVLLVVRVSPASPAPTVDKRKAGRAARPSPRAACLADAIRAGEQVLVVHA